MFYNTSICCMGWGFETPQAPAFMVILHLRLLVYPETKTGREKRSPPPMMPLGFLDRSGEGPADEDVFVLSDVLKVQAQPSLIPLKPGERLPPLRSWVRSRTTRRSWTLVRI